MAATEQKLPPYDSEAKCPKCGHDEVRTSFAEKDWPRRCVLNFRCPCEGEHLHRRCVRCGYDWMEAVIE